jgi:hypothetical protein
MTKGIQMTNKFLSSVLTVSVLTALGVCGAASASSLAEKPISVTASADDGNSPDRLIDGDLNTRWSASGEGAWVEFDYGAVSKINAIKAAFHKGDTRTTTFDVEVSQDGKTWEKVITQQNSSGQTNGLERYDFKEVEARYVRLTGYGNTSNKWNSLTELQAVDCNVVTCSADEVPAVPVLTPANISSSSDDGNVVANLLDDNLDTRWSANGDSQWAMFDYGKAETFDAVRLAFYKGDARSSTFDIEVSEDGQTWTKVVTDAKSSGALATHERFEFAPVKAQFVRYVGHGNTSNTWNSLTEMMPLNCKVNTCPVNEIITEEVIKAAKLAAEEKKRMITHVGKQTTLDDWKLTIPETYATFYSGVTKELTANAIDVDKAAEILPSECSVDGSALTAATKNDYFWADEKGWHFRTPLEGGATTPNSTYIRSELRELAGNWKPCGDTSLANWSYGGEHTLVATLSLDEIPAKPVKKDGVTPDAPKVVLGQIHAHDIDAATVKLLWEGNDKPVRVILNKNTEKSAFSVSLGNIGDPTKPWSYLIKMTDKGIELSAGGVTKKLSFGNELDNVWKDQTFYFKAGLYPQVNKESGGAFAATFSKLSIDHKARAGDFGAKVPLMCEPAVSDCTCLETNPDCVWWDVPLKAPVIPAKPLPGNKPGQNFDLTTWYLSQPFDHDANGKPDDVFEQYLAQGYEHPEVFYTADDGGLVFKSYIKGVRTSNNTKYVRTELREMLRAGDLSIATQGVNKNNWVFSSAPVADQKAAGGVDGIMNATLKIDHTTTTGEAGQVGRFIIGQIHDKDDEPIRLYYRKLPDQEKGTVYFAHENTRLGSDEFFPLVGGMNGISDDGIALGEVFSYQIKVVGNTMTVTVMREGKPDAVQVVDMSESGYDVGGRYMYFKAGVYNQNNSGDPDDYVQATFYKLEKSHGVYQE